MIRKKGKKSDKVKKSPVDDFLVPTPEPLMPEPEVVEPEPDVEVIPGESEVVEPTEKILVIPKKKALSCKSGVVDHEDSVKMGGVNADMFIGGEETIDDLIGRGLLVEMDKKDE